MEGTMLIALDVTKVVSNWITFLDSLLGSFSESEAFKLYNEGEDTLFYDRISEEDKYVLMEYLDDYYRTPLNNHLEKQGYEILRVVNSDLQKDPSGLLTINLIMSVIPIT